MEQLEYFKGFTDCFVQYITVTSSSKKQLLVWVLAGIQFLKRNLESNSLNRARLVENTARNLS